MSAVSGSVPEEPLKLREVRRESAVERVGTAAEEDILEPEALENLERFQPDIAPVRSPFSIESEESKKAAERCFHVKKREVTERDTQAQKSRGKRDYQSPKQLFIRSESVQKRERERRDNSENSARAVGANQRGKAQNADEQIEESDRSFSDKKELPEILLPMAVMQSRKAIYRSRPQFLP